MFDTVPDRLRALDPRRQQMTNAANADMVNLRRLERLMRAAVREESRLAGRRLSDTEIVAIGNRVLRDPIYAAATEVADALIR
jgi:hypothetical protein